MIDFYKSDEVSRTCPVLREFVKKFNENCEPEKVQRRLVRMNLNEAFELFQKDFPESDSQNLLRLDHLNAC